MTQLDTLVRDMIAAEGPISVARFMQLALQHPEHGYYVRGCPVGASGDFITSPEISQMFGEMIGLWCAQMWLQMESPQPFVLLELGPGRGTLMADALRATARVPGFHQAMQLYLLESNETLRAEQTEKLKGHDPKHITDLGQLPALPVIAIANEFFDAMPVHQYRRSDKGWCEVMIGAENGALVFTQNCQNAPLPLPDVLDFYEVSPVSISLTQQLASHIAAHNGTALVVDYGYQTPSGHNTVQAVSGHKTVDMLEEIGARDITAHVDFSALKIAAEKQGATASAVVGQGAFLKNLGIDIRARQLKMMGGLDQSYQIEADVQRLTDETQMGTLFKVMAFSNKSQKDIPGFP